MSFANTKTCVLQFTVTKFVHKIKGFTHLSDKYLKNKAEILCNRQKYPTISKKLPI